MNDIWRLIAENYIKDLETSTALGCVCKAWQRLPHMKTIGELLRDGEDLPEPYVCRMTQLIAFHMKYFRVSSCHPSDPLVRWTYNEMRYWFVWQTGQLVIKKIRWLEWLTNSRVLFIDLCKGPLVFTHHKQYLEGRQKHGPVVCHEGIKWMVRERKKLIDRADGFFAACSGRDWVTASLVCPRPADRVKREAVRMAVGMDAPEIIEILHENGANIGRRDFVRAVDRRAVRVMRVILDLTPQMRLRRKLAGEFSPDWHKMLM